MIPFPGMRRDLGGLRDGGELDLLVVGGGINGAGIARDARLRGLSVALLDQGDWASGTSSRSSRLIHGGLRYLEHGRLGLVRESLRERATLLKIAPHLVEPLRFVAPAWGDGERGLTTLGIGVALYELLAGRRRLERRRSFGPAAAAELEPELRHDRLEGAIAFTDARCDDARLVLATVRSAWQAGALCANYCRIDELVATGGRVRGAVVTDLLRGERLELRARAVVNATGPWADRTAALAREGTRRVRLTRGAHVVVPRLSREALLLPTRDRRVLFVLPWGPYSVLGTTDTDHEGGLDDVGATESDVRFLLEEAGRALPRASLGPGSVIASWAALRPLVAGSGAPGSLSREHRIEVGPSGLVSVIGGKLTSFRALAAAVVDRVMAILARPAARPVTDVLPIDGGDTEDFPRFVAAAAAELASRHRLPREHAERLARTYGTRVSEVSAMLREEPRLLARLCANHPHLAVEAAYAAGEEMAVTLSDFLFRRTRVAYVRCGGQDCADLAAAAMATVTGWKAPRIEDEVRAFSEEAARLTRPRPG